MSRGSFWDLINSEISKYIDSFPRYFVWSVRESKWIKKVKQGVVFYFRKRRERVKRNPVPVLYRFITPLRVHTHLVK